MSATAEIAAMRLALDALEDRAAPPVLVLAAWRYVYRGEREFFLGLLREAFPNGVARGGVGDSE